MLCVCGKHDFVLDLLHFSFTNVNWSGLNKSCKFCYMIQASSDVLSFGDGKILLAKYTFFLSIISPLGKVLKGDLEMKAAAYEAQP